MFNTLESSWDQSARRGWSTLASFGFQAMALSLLLAIPLIWVQAPPRIAWLQSPVAAPVIPVAEPPRIVRHEAAQHYTANSVSNLLNGHILIPSRIPRYIAEVDDTGGGPAPNLPGIEFGRKGPGGVPYGLGDAIPVIVPPPPVDSHPRRVSHWAEGNVVYRVQPAYPPIAKQVRVQGAVVLRAIISKTGTIEHLTAVSGPPLLVKAAVDAVQRWRYRPYLLNDEPIEIETEITVNFVLSGQ